MTALTEQDVRRIVREEISAYDQERIGAITHEVRPNIGTELRAVLESIEAAAEVVDRARKGCAQVSKKHELLGHVAGSAADVVGSVSRLESLGRCGEACVENREGLADVSLRAHVSPSNGHPSVEEPRS